MPRSSAMLASPSASPSSTNATSWNAPVWRNSTSAPLGKNCPKARQRCWSHNDHALRLTRKPPKASMASKPENPSEPFKRAVSVAVRSLAGEPELEVAFSSEPPSLKGLKARLPTPTRTLPAHEVALVRGVGDAYALRKAYHDEKVNAQFRPGSADASAIFEAAESARVEAIGSIAMAGVRMNLAAGLEQRLNQRGLAKARTREEAPIADVMGLMVRERLTGEKPPANVAAAVDLWRPFI